MRMSLKLDDKLLIISLIFLSLFLASIGLVTANIISGNFDLLIVILLFGYLINFAFFLYYNHKLERKKSEEKNLLDFNKTYRISFIIGFFIFIIGLVGILFNFNILLMALVSSGFLVMIYSLIGQYDISIKSKS
ncbi:MAG: DUF417 family protein [Thermoplasmatota archaeon]